MREISNVASTVEYEVHEEKNKFAAADKADADKADADKAEVYTFYANDHHYSC